MITLDDFPHPANLGAMIYIHWVQLWDSAGQISQGLTRKGGGRGKASLAKELIHWVQSLPSSLHLPVGDFSVLDFNPDVYYLHLGYLTVVIILHSVTSRESLPKASVPAMAAASCIAHIFQAYLSRGSVQYLGCEASWYVTVAILALLHAQGIEELAPDAERDIEILLIALDKLSAWSQTGKMFKKGLDRLLKAMPLGHPPVSHDTPGVDDIHCFSLSEGPDEMATTDGSEWMDYFPYISAQTSSLIAALMVKNCMTIPFPEMSWPDDITLQLQLLFNGIEGTRYDEMIT